VLILIRLLRQFGLCPRVPHSAALGTPFCITVDHQTLEDQTVTIRHRDTMAQDRVKIADLRGIINDEVSVRNWLLKMK